MDTAVRLSKYFGLSERFWLNIQTGYEIDVEKQNLKNRLDKEVKIYSRTTVSASQYSVRDGRDVDFVLGKLQK